MLTIKPQDFSDSTRDATRHMWTLGKIEFVVDVLKEKDVLVEVDSRTGHTVRGRIVGYATSGTTHSGERLKVANEFGTTGYRLAEVGVIVDLDESTGSKWGALRLFRDGKSEAIAQVRPEAEESGRTYGKWSANPLGFGRYHVRYEPQREDGGEPGLWTVNL